MKLIEEAHQEAHECNASAEVHDWIDWFKKMLNKTEEENKIICRDCGKPMKQYPLGVLAWGCRECKLKAEIQFMDMPIVKING